MVPLTLLIPLIFTLMHSAVAHAEHWVPPLPSVDVMREFDFEARTPFAAGARRGLRLAGEPGQTVRAPCSESMPAITSTETPMACSAVAGAPGSRRARSARTTLEATPNAPSARPASAMGWRSPAK